MGWASFVGVSTGTGDAWLLGWLGTELHPTSSNAIANTQNLIRIVKLIND
jgi:hypothetical protein